MAAAALALTIAAAPARAERPGWPANSVVSKLVVTFDGGINIRLSPDLTSCQSQSGYGANYASIYPARPGVNRLKADLLAAYLTGKTVSLYFTDPTCKIGELILGGW